MARFEIVRTAAVCAALVFSAQSAVAQGVDCTDPANATAEVCIALNQLPIGDVDNVLFLAAPFALTAGILLGGTGGGTSPTTPSTN